MKVSSFVFMLLTIGLIFTIVGLIINDNETEYGVDIDSSWEDEWDYSTEINSSVHSLKDKFDTISDEEEGWFTRISAGIVAIPEAVIFVPRVILQTLGNSLNFVAGAGEVIGIPPEIITFGIIAVIVGVIFALVAYWRRYKA